MRHLGQGDDPAVQFWSVVDGEAAVTKRGVVPRLFCLPHAGSGAAGFHRWKRELAGRIAVCPVRLPGREMRMTEPALRSVGTTVDAVHTEMMREASAWLQQPYAIFGHSMSALTAFEWVRRIQAEGLPLPLQLWVSGRNGPRELSPGEVPDVLHQMDDREFLEALAARYGGAERQGVMEDAEIRALVLPTLRADLEAVETYRFQSGESLRCPVRAVAGAQDATVSDEGLARWTAVSATKFATARLPGDHFYHFGAGQAELLEEFVRVLIP